MAGDGAGRPNPLPPIDGRVVSRVVHDLQSPLASLLEALELLEQGRLGELDEAQQEIIGLCSRNSRRLWTRLVKLTEWFRLQCGHAEFAVRPCNLTQLAQSAFDRAAGGGLPEALWKLVGRSEELMVQGDPARLRQMLGELFENAARFSTPESAVQVRLQRKTEEAKPAAVVQIAHSAVPLEAAPDDPFEPFYPLRIGKPSAKQGLGLGLPIARLIARQSGGDVSWKREGDARIVFRVWLPLA